MICFGDLERVTDYCSKTRFVLVSYGDPHKKQGSRLEYLIDVSSLQCSNFSVEFLQSFSPQRSYDQVLALVVWRKDVREGEGKDTRLDAINFAKDNACYFQSAINSLELIWN